MDDPVRPSSVDAGKSGKSPARRFALFLGPVLIVVSAIALANYSLVGRTVGEALGSDPRNAGFALTAHFDYYVSPSTLVLNLTRADAAAPLDLLRGVFQAAVALGKAGRSFETVILARSGKARFRMTGAAFTKLGEEFAAGQNPVYLIRTFPEKLYRPDGTAAFETWTGGLLGVVGQQMKDVSEAARIWAEAP